MCAEILNMRQTGVTNTPTTLRIDTMKILNVTVVAINSDGNTGFRYPTVSACVYVLVSVYIFISNVLPRYLVVNVCVCVCSVHSYRINVRI